jgi:hypothetical protein
MGRNTTIRILLAVYALSSVAVALALFLGLPDTGDLSGTTSGHILAAAILALAFGATIAARDPWEHRRIIQIIIAFTVMATVVIAVRVATHSFHTLDRAWVLVPVSAACPILLGLFYPRHDDG